MYQSIKNILLKDWKNNLVLLLAFCVFFPFFHFTFYILFLVGLFTIKSISVKLNKRKALPYLLLLSYVIWGYFTLVYTSNINVGLQQVEKGIPLLLICVIGLFGSYKPKVNFSRFQSIYWYGALFSNAFIGIVSLYRYFFSEAGAMINVYGGGVIDFIEILQHRTYYIASIAISFPFIFSNLSKQEKLKSILLLFSLIIFIVVIYFSGARAGFLTVLSVMLFLSFYVVIRKWKTSVIIPFMIILVGVFAFVFYKSPRIQQIADEIKNGNKIEKLNSRAAPWNASLELAKENAVFGVGIGDYQDELNKKYIRSGHILEASRKLNSHNQYLQTIVERGGIGIVLLLLFFISLPFAVDKRKRIYAYTFLIIFGINFLFESMLNRNLAIFPVVFWTFVLLSVDFTYDEIKAEKYGFKLWSILVILLVILFSIIIANKPRAIDYGNPHTYMTVPFKQLLFDDLPSKDDLPNKTNGVLLENQIIKWEKYSGEKYLSAAIYQNNKFNSQSVKYSYWCYVSKDCNLNNVAIYISKESQLNRLEEYDMSHRGIWQKLEVKKVDISKLTTVGLRINMDEEKEMTGNVIFALPILEFNN